jgi:hypothetical protein
VLGKRADVVLDKNPLTVEAMAITDIQMLETIHAEKTIFTEEESKPCAFSARLSREAGRRPAVGRHRVEFSSLEEG